MERAILRRSEAMKNSEALLEALKDFISGENEFISSYIGCPYINNKNCTYDGTPKTARLCDDCKSEWLEKEWEE